MLSPFDQLDCIASFIAARLCTSREGYKYSLDDVLELASGKGTGEQYVGKVKYTI